MIVGLVLVDTNCANDYSTWVLGKYIIEYQYICAANAAILCVINYTSTCAELTFVAQEILLHFLVE